MGGLRARVAGAAAVAAGVGLVAGACALRLGGPDPVEYRVMTVAPGAGESAQALAARIRSAGARAVLVSAARDSAWFAAVAAGAGLQLSGPGDVGATSYAFLTSVEALGDTTVTLRFAGDSMRVHDALYPVGGEDWFLDLMALRVPGAPHTRPAVDALLRYMATDVMNEAAVVMAIEAPDAATLDEVVTILSPAFRTAEGCMRGDAAAADAGPRMVFGLEARVECRSARRVEDGVVAELVIGLR